jgi:hypothetical protein
LFSVASAEGTIIRELGQRGTATFDELVSALPQLSWSQIFLAVDRLSRTGTLSVRHDDGLHYVVTISPSTEGGPREANSLS